MIPSGLLPMLATAGPLPIGAAWAYEVKWDGYRVLAAVEGRRTTLRSRRGRDVTLELPDVRLDLPDCLVDGEVVALVNGKPEFQALQTRSVPLSFVPFDVLHVGERSLLGATYDERRAVLAELVPDAPPSFEDGSALLESTRLQGLEGVLAKRRDSTYLPGRRSECWVKTKHVRRQSAVVVGWRRGEGGRAGRIGSLLLGLPSEDGFRYVGRVGTGFTASTLEALQEQLTGTERATAAVANPPREAAVWVEPTMVVDVDFTEWTSDGRLRHPSYKGVRDDLDPRALVRE
ncbi:MAG TPA: non-homologous end-joining DNA ligase [Mycobacteriales bacterium]|nr:non-homologous end-joining DNA ligase [Mycobacteriales bacterium]